MKRREFIKHLEKNGCKMLREGGRHSVYWNPQANKTSTVPRHTEVADQLAKKICKDLGIPPVK
jgi:mRNA interferase HicA